MITYEMGARGESFRINFKAFLKHLIHGKGEKHTFSFLKVFYDHLPFNNKKNAFIYSLEDLGFESIPVPLKAYAPGENQKAFYKSRTDQLITIHIMDAIHDNEFDHLVLVSGDSDYEFVIQKCRAAGKTVEIWATSTTLSNELRRVANRYYLFDDSRFKHLLMKVKDDRQSRKKVVNG